MNFFQALWRVTNLRISLLFAHLHRRWVSNKIKRNFEKIARFNAQLNVKRMAMVIFGSVADSLRILSPGESASLPEVRLDKGIRFSATVGIEQVKILIISSASESQTAEQLKKSLWRIIPKFPPPLVEVQIVPPK